MLCFLKWLVQIPIFILSTLAAWLVAPIAPLFRDENYRLPKWLEWCSTPHTDLRGDRKHREKYEDESSYMQMVHWIVRNPAVVFQREFLGVQADPSDQYVVIGNPETGDTHGWYFSRLYRDGKLIAWQIYALLEYPFYRDKGKCCRILLGWKLWKSPKTDQKNQMAFRVTLWKSFIPEK